MLWAIAKELRALATVACQVRAGRELQQALGAARIWPRRHPLVRTALERLDAARLCALVDSAARADRVIKGQLAGRPWDRLAGLVAALSGATAPEAARA